MTLLNGAAAALFERPRTELQGRTDLELLDDPAQAEIVMANDREVMEKGDSREFEEMAGEVDGRSRIWLSTKTPLRDPAGEVVGLVGVSIDITARKQAEDRLRQMVDELSHRVKNTLVTVQSIAAHTLRGADPVVYQMLEGRLQALAAVHDVLTGESWKDAGLIEVIDNALAPFVVGGAAQLTIDGPPIRLQPRVAVTLAIALHELATNAIKYGAWSDAAGQVRLTWEIVQGSAPRLRMIWAEERGPRVEAPTVRGFGSRMIERSLAHDLGGTAQIAFHANGLVCTMEAPLEEIAATTRALPLPRVGAMPEAGAWR
jgi:PAS domain S-box-containing protein